MTLETNTVISVNYFKISRNALKIYIANVLLIISVTTSLILLILIIFYSYFSKLLALPTEWLFIGVIVTLMQFLTTINLVLWQSEQNPIPFGIYQIPQTIFNLSLSLILIIGFGMGWKEGFACAEAGFGMFRWWLWEEWWGLWVRAMGPYQSNNSDRYSLEGIAIL